MNKRRWIYILEVICMVMMLLYAVPATRVSAATEGSIKAGTTNLYFRETPGGTPIKDNNGNTIFLNGGQKLTIQDTSNSSWYKVTLTYNGATYTGYVAASYVVTGGEQAPSTPGNDADFEAKLTAQGFPDSYKPYLRAIHEKYPTWEFKAVHTGVDWNTLMANEVSKPGQVKNLIYGTNSYPHYNWRSTSVGYNIATDTWSSYDGTTWFAASDELVAYYMDPRTYLYENYVFAFESLSYQEGMQNETGVEAILKGTFMYQTKPAGESRTYAQLIMEAAKQSGVSPYHIASRIKLEMGSTIGTACSGTNSTYPGIYNFYNIGAYNTPNGNAAVKGLEWAAGSGSYGRPWNTVAKSIIGGAQFLGASYINVGQNTLYTQKFNVTNKSCLFSHQYMGNIQSPATECLTNYNAYKNNNLLNSSMVFEIPVYSNLPAQAVSKPADSGNPNNWLKTLSIQGYSLTPSYAINNTTDYSLIVSSSVEQITVSATTVNKYAKVSGTGTVSLQPGTNVINLVVTAQSGATRTYKITVVRGSTSDTPATPGTSSKRGDLNGDGKITALDIVKVQRIIVGLDGLDSNVLAVADVNKDGKVTALDIVKIQRHIVGLETIN
ncbi:MAG: dockerin type I domain-containing protein [Wujia sp.]